MKFLFRKGILCEYSFIEELMRARLHGKINITSCKEIQKKEEL